jgi:hypothetical protein
VLWNGVITQSLQDVKPVIDRALSQGIDFLPNQNQSLWTRWFSGATDSSTSDFTSTMRAVREIRLANLDQNKTQGVNPFPESLGYKLQIVDIPYPNPFFGEKVAATYSNLLIFSRTFFQIFAFFGLILFLRRYFFSHDRIRQRQITPGRSQTLDLLGIGLAAIIIGLAARTSGTLGPSYNPERTALQVAIVLLIPTAVGIEYLLFRKKFIQIFLAVPIFFFLMVLLFQATSLGGYVTGSDVTRISNLNSNYSPFVISESERRASRWLSENVPTTSYLQTDSRGFLALLQYGRRTDFISLDPVNLLKESYIYAANSNVVGGVARAQRFLVFPEDYIDKHYQIIYSSSRARIYH